VPDPPGWVRHSGPDLGLLREFFANFLLSFPLRTTAGHWYARVLLMQDFEVRTVKPGVIPLPLIYRLGERVISLHLNPLYGLVSNSSFCRAWCA